MFVVMVELILLLLCCGSSPTLFYILHRQKRQKRKALFVLSFCFFSSSYYGKFFLSRQLANKQRLGSELLVVVRLLIAIFSYSSLVIKQIIVHTRRRSGNSCRRATNPFKNHRSPIFSLRTAKLFHLLTSYSNNFNPTTLSAKFFSSLSLSLLQRIYQ